MASSCWSPLVGQPISPEHASEISRVFKALGDPVRLRLLSLISSHAGGEACVCDLTEVFDLSGPTISHHLKVLREAELIEPYERVHRLADGRGDIDAAARTIAVYNEETGTIRVLSPDRWPESLEATNLDRLGWNLLHAHPMTIEIAGVILLMAMLGATVLARKHVELEDSRKAEQALRLGAPDQPRHTGRARTGGAS